MPSIIFDGCCGGASRRIGWRACSRTLRLRRLRDLVASEVSRALTVGPLPETEARLDRIRSFLRQQRHVLRDRFVAESADQQVDGEDTLLRLDALRWLHRVAYHVWRITHHNRVASEGGPLDLAAELKEPDDD